MKTTLLVGSTPDALAEELIQRISAIARESIEARGVFNIAVSGGSMPKILAGWADAEGMDFSKSKIWFADERCVPLDHDDSNYKAWEALFRSAGIPPANIMAVATDLPPEEAAADYETKIKEAFSDAGDADAPQFLPCFDALLLGVGPDGHTCSLFPGHVLLEEKEKWVAHIEDSPKPPPNRVTLSYPVLNNARNVMFIGTGKGKASLLPKLLCMSNGALTSAGASSPYPAARVTVGEGRELLWCIDQAAASECPREIINLATTC